VTANRRTREVGPSAGSGAREGRHQAREAALQVLYVWEVGRIPIDAALDSYWSLQSAGLPPREAVIEEFAAALARGTVAHLDDLDPLIAQHAQHWRLPRMAIIDRLILRLAVYEFVYEPKTPRTVVINEALELAKTFSEPEAVRFVNGILDAVKRRLEEPSAETAPPPDVAEPEGED
jgi:transcription antitermination protein NusB